MVITVFACKFEKNHNNNKEAIYFMVLLWLLSNGCRTVWHIDHVVVLHTTWLQVLH